MTNVNYCLARPRRRKRIGGLLAALLVAGVVAACSSGGDGSSGGDAVTTATVQLGWLPNIENGSIIDAKTKGYYSNEGLNVTIAPGGPEVAIDAQLVSGNALVGMMSTETLAAAVQNGAPLVGVGAIYQYSSTVMVSLKGENITKPQDLIGKRVGVTTSDKSTKPFLQSQGIDINKIDWVTVNAVASDLTSQHVDAITSTAGAMPVVLAAQGIPTNVFYFADYGVNRWSSVLSVRKDSLSDPAKLKAIEGIVRGTIKGTQDLINDPTAVGEAVYNEYGKQLGLSEDSQVQGAKVWAGLVAKGRDFSGGSLLQITPKGVQSQQKFLGDIIHAHVQAASIFDTTSLHGVFND